MRYSKIIDAVTQAFLYGDMYTYDYVIPTLTEEEQARCYAIGKRFMTYGFESFAEDIEFLYRERDMERMYHETMQKGA